MGVIVAIGHMRRAFMDKDSLWVERTLRQKRGIRKTFLIELGAA